MPTITAYQGGLTPSAPITSEPTIKQPDINKTEANVSSTGETIPKTETANEDSNLSSRLAKLAQKEKFAHQQRKQLQSERAELAKLKEELSHVQSWKDKLVKEPLSVLNEAGLTYDQLTQLVLNGGNAQTPESLELQKIQKEIESMKQAQTEAQKANEERVKQQFEQTRQQLKLEVVETITSNPAYSRVTDMDSEEAAVELIVQRFQSDGVILSAEQAVKEVNDYLKEEQEKFIKLPSIQELLKQHAELQAAQTQAQTKPTPQFAKKPALKTLSSSMNTASKPSRNETWAEKKARAIAKVTGQIS